MLRGIYKQYLPDLAHILFFVDTGAIYKCYLQRICWGLLGSESAPCPGVREIYHNAVLPFGTNGQVIYRA